MRVLKKICWLLVLNLIENILVIVRTNLGVVGAAGSVGDDPARVREHPAGLVAGSRGRGAEHGQASPADDY